MSASIFPDEATQLDISNHITMPVPAFMAAAGIGRSKVYELIGAGEIQSVLVGRRRLVIVQSYGDYLERQSKAQSAGVGRIASPNPRARPPAPPAARREAKKARNSAAKAS